VVTPSDAAFMERALFHAERGRGRTSPNPIVGAVVVSASGVVVGHGAHLVAGGAHAEVHALDAAGSLASGGTLYCTLEPCSHTGRTGPCAARIVAAGLSRVVAAAGDRDPRVAGRGFAYLRTHGIDVTEGVGREAAERQLAPFFRRVTANRPFVIAKTAVSVDGFVGRRSERVQLTGPIADRHFQRQRAEMDAIMVGAGTVIADDPLLTARGAYRFRPLTRVIVDWRARVPATARVFSTLTSGPVIMVVDRRAAATAPHLAGLVNRGVIVETFDTGDLESVLQGLARRDIVTLLLEGGPALQTAFAEARAIDRVQWVMTPHRLGHGVPAATCLAPDAAGMTGRRTLFGNDVLIEFDVHRTG
jgi:diaminohydroxyphosphoribosylaminopyrimidine deaminase / 5-amino-6-(5-phosphoribosylamino)uracil reductase